MNLRVLVAFVGMTFVGLSSSYADIASTKYVDDIANTKQAKLIAGENITINGNTINATGTTASTMTGASASAPGTAGLVPAPTAGKQAAFLRGDGTWAVPDTGDSAVSKVRIGETGTNLADMWIE